MEIARIEHLADKLRGDNKKERPGAIVLLGAGASQSAGIPLAKEILSGILEEYRDYSKIKELSVGDRKDYYKVMKCIDHADKKELFQKYIDRAKINVSHIYLAQLMAKGYVDYIMTVNFDNLTQRALALYNLFPATYDMAMAKGITTATFNHPGIVFLHGQHHGFYLLNTEEEFEKAKGSIKQSLERICNRPWIVVGYSGNDYVLDNLCSLGPFDHGLYWVGYKDEEPNEKVKNNLFKDNSKNAYLIKGEDSDSFFLNLHTALLLPDPHIISQPFTYLKKLQADITDIDGDKYTGIKERLNITQKWIGEAIEIFENGRGYNIPDVENDKEIRIDNVIKDLIGVITKKEYNRIPAFEEQLKGQLGNEQVKEILGSGYYLWGTHLGGIADTTSPNDREPLYREAFQKYADAVRINPDKPEAWYSWGTDLGNLAGLKSLQEAEALYIDAFEKYKEAIRLKPDKYEAWYNWGTDLGKLADAKPHREADSLYQEAFEKFAKAVTIEPEYYEAWYNWGIALGKLARMKPLEEAEPFYREAIEKYSEAARIKPDSYFTWDSWGAALGKFADTQPSQEAESLYHEAFKKFATAVRIEPEFHEAWVNWGTALSKVARIKPLEEAESLYREAIEKYSKAVRIKPDYSITWDNWSDNLIQLSYNKSGDEKQAILLDALEKSKTAMELGESSYNYSCVNALLGNTEEAFKYLEETLSKQQTAFEHVENDKDWDGLREDDRYIKLKDKYGNK